MKKYLSIILVSALIASLASCGESTSTSSTVTEEKAVPTETTAEVMTTTEVTTAAETTVTTTITTTIAETTTIPETTTVTEPPTEPPTLPPTEPPTEPPTPAPTEPPTTPPAESQETTVSPDMIKSILELSIKQSIENCKVDYDENSNNYIVNVWQDGVASGAILAASGGDKSSWDYMVKTFETTSSTLKESINSIDPNAHLTLSVLNDLNTENVLLTILDGVTIYDYVNG